MVMKMFLVSKARVSSHTSTSQKSASCLLEICTEDNNNNTIVWGQTTRHKRIRESSAPLQNAHFFHLGIDYAHVVGFPAGHSCNYSVALVLHSFSIDQPPIIDKALVEQIYLFFFFLFIGKELCPTKNGNTFQ